MKMLFIRSVALALMTATQVFAQDLCSPILQHGIYDSFREYSDQANSQTIDNQVCEAYSKLLTDKTSGHLSASYGIGKGDVSMTREQLEAIAQSKCDRRFSSSSDKDLVEKAGRFISPAAVEAWRDCTARQAAASSNGGLVVDTKFLGEELGGTGVSVSLRNAPTTGRQTSAPIFVTQIDLDPKTLKCSGPLWEKLGSLQKPSSGVPLENSFEGFQCTRDLAQAPIVYAGRRVLAVPATVTVYTGAETVVRKLSAVPIFPPPVPYGLGDVVASMLDERSFRETHGAGWVLADGRDVSGSAYERLTGRKTTPDLRGVFLRGKNYRRDFASGNEEGDLPLGQYQSDEFKHHDHDLDPAPQSYSAPEQRQYDLTPTANLMGHVSKTKERGGKETRPRSVTVSFFIKVD